ncbi:MAG TPA: DUF4386 domain-containing protein [Candidatus Dormibacteraeota bacterium]|nr:DUF4386 domain-containing protein [Candidatus Dormibacteraeota bacterium]
MGFGPKGMARIAGALYLVNILAGAFAIGFVPEVTGGNAQGHDLLVRSGVAAHVLVTATNVPLAMLFYELFKVVDRRAAILVAFFTLVGTAVEAGGIVNPRGLSYEVSTVFFGFYAATMGYLVYRSVFMPRAIGVLMAVDGAAYLVNSFASILAPGFAAHLVPYIQMPVLFGEGSLCLWFLIAGVNEERWRRLQ